MSTKRLEEFFNTAGRGCLFKRAVFEGPVPNNIKLWINSLLPPKEQLTPEEHIFIDRQIDKLRGEVQAMLSKLKQGSRVRVVRAGSYQGLEGVIRQVTGDLSSPDKSSIQFGVQLGQQQLDFMAFDLEVIPLPKGTFVPSTPRSAPPFSPQNLPNIYKHR
jgi:hypothetical protein